MLLEIENTCNDQTLSGILSIVKNIITIIEIVVPIMLIVWSMYGLFQLMQNPEKKNGGKEIVNKFIAAIIVFIIPVLLNTVMNIVGESTKFSSCWNNSDTSIELGNTYLPISNEKTKKLPSGKDYEKGSGIASTKMNFSKAIEIPTSVLKNASHSDPSIVVADSNGNVIAQRKPNVLREGGSTTKVFTGYAAVKLLDVKKDYVEGTQYAINFVGEYNTNTLAAGQKISVPAAATRAFPGSSNTGAESIAIAIGYKYYKCSSPKEAHLKGVKKINEFIKSVGCKNSNLGNASGLDFAPPGRMRFSRNGYPKDGCKDGHSAADLALITIEAMKDKNFASGIKGRNNEGMFFIKSGTGYLCHGIWGFNKNGKRYYIALLGIDCQFGGKDNKYTVAKDIYNWAVQKV